MIKEFHFHLPRGVAYQLLWIDLNKWRLTVFNYWVWSIKSGNFGFIEIRKEELL